jgi:phosphatidylinositol-3-phosphatase
MPAYDHVVWIVMENHSYNQIIGSRDAPYITQLANRFGLATNFYAESHPSLPNYLAMTSGSTQGVVDDNPPEDHRLEVPSIFSLLPDGASRSLEESMPANCYQTDSGE